MTVTNLKDLSKLIDLCRKKGIDEIQIDNIKFKLGSVDEPKRYNPDPEVTSNQIEYTPEQMMFWSSDPMAGVS